MKINGRSLLRVSTQGQRLTSAPPTQSSVQESRAKAALLAMC
jgi:hypothetical protein